MRALFSSRHSRICSVVAYKRLALVVVCVALLLDNMIYMVIVPIIPIYFAPPNATDANPHSAYDLASSDISIGVLFAFKAIVQLFVSPVSGTLIDKFGYRNPMVFGLMSLIVSTNVFAYGRSYGVLIFARGLQGVGSAFADTAALSMIADIYVEDNERNTALGIAQAFISFGTLAAPPFGGVLFDLFGKNVPFILLSLMAFADLVLFLFLITSKITLTINREFSRVAAGTPIWRLMLDPFIAICAGALSMANISLAFLEPTIGNWMHKKLNAKSWQIGFVWFPAIVPHWLGVYFTIWFSKHHRDSVWAFTMAALALEALSCILIPLCRSFWTLIIPISGICFGCALIDTALLPTMAFLVDSRHTSDYGSIYAIVDISYNIAYALGPIIAGSVVTSIGFPFLNIIICVVTAIYVPVLKRLRDVTRYEYSNDIGQEEDFCEIEA